MSSSGNSADETGTPASELTRLTSVTSMNSSKSVQFKDPANEAGSVADSDAGNEEPPETGPKETLQDDAPLTSDGVDPFMGDDAMIDDSEDPEMLRVEVKDDLMGYNSFGPSLTERKKKAPQRVLQIAQYVKLIEDRMSDMEKKLEELTAEKAKDPKSDPLYDSALPPLPDLQPEALITAPRKLNWEDFRKAGIEKPTHVLDILIEKPQMGLKRHKQSLQNSHMDMDLVQDKPGSGHIERIRINSTRILHVIEAVAGSDLRPTTDACVMIRPFKVLLAFENQFQDHLKTLDEQIKSDEESVEDPTQEGTLPASEELTNGKAVAQEPNPDSAPPALHDRADSYTSESKLFGGLPGVDPLPESKEDPVAVRKETAEHLRCLLKFLNTDLKDELEILRKLRSANATSVAFKDLWHLFYPGCVIFDNGLAQQAYRVRNVKGGRPRLCNSAADPSADPYQLPGDPFAPATTNRNLNLTEEELINPFTIECFSFDFDGEQFGPVQYDKVIDRYDGAQPILKLPVFPIEYLPDFNKKEGNMLDKLLKRGKDFAELADGTNSAHREYNGLSFGDIREQIESQVIVDFGLYFQKHQKDIPMLGLTEQTEADSREVTENLLCPCGRPSCTLIIPDHSIYDDSKVDQQLAKEFFSDKKSRLLRPVKGDKSALSDDQLRLLPNKVYAFVLRNRKWYALDISEIREISNSSQSFNDLVLPDNTRELVEGLVRTHSKGIKPSSGAPGEEQLGQLDLVSGKGKGLIILLHGAPGVGKTSTAECVANYTNRPLFPITCGDIGETAKEVQDNLEQNFQLAHRWGCVMLLDEADVFLQARDRQDMKRNAIVSVFLRVLEYYSGILFLTTNKVGKFDEAFKSRIHISLYYPKLDRAATRKIWDVNLKRLKQFKPTLDFDNQEILGFAENHWEECTTTRRPSWNGRQIRNAFQTAVALAEFDSVRNKKPPTMTAKHFNLVAAASKNFEKYLKNVHGSYSEEKSKREQDRDDGFNEDFDEEEERRREIDAMRRQPFRSGAYSGRYERGTPRNDRAPFDNTPSRFGDYESEMPFDAPPGRESPYANYPPDYRGGRQGSDRLNGQRGRGLDVDRRSPGGPGY